jgi:hypothetical protein
LRGWPWLLLVACSIDDRNVDTSASAGAAGSGSAALVTSNQASNDLGNPAAPSSSAAPSAPGSGSGPSEPPSLPAPGAGCRDAQRRCVAGAPEQCSGGAWVPLGPCAAPLQLCLPSTGLCVSCEPGAQRCTGERVEGCSAQGTWESQGIACSECIPNAGDCLGSTARICSAQGVWVGQVCTASTPLCVAATGSCACTQTSCPDRELCSASGRCEPLGSDCPAPAAVASGEQDVAIVRVRFDPDGSADVLFENLGGGFVSFAAGGFQLCNGRGNCVFLSDDQSITLVGDQTFSRRIPNTVASGGELALLFFGSDASISAEAYVAWGNGPGADSLEAAVNAELRLWVTGERIQVAAEDTGFVCLGDTSRAASYTSCHP